MHNIQFLTEYTGYMAHHVWGLASAVANTKHARILVTLGLRPVHLQWNHKRRHLFLQSAGRWLVHCRLTSRTQSVSEVPSSTILQSFPRDAIGALSMAFEAVSLWRRLPSLV